MLMFCCVARNAVSVLFISLIFSLFFFVSLDFIGLVLSFISVCHHLGIWTHPFSS